MASFGGRTSFRGASPNFFFWGGGSRVHLGETQGHTHLVGQVGNGLERSAKTMDMVIYNWCRRHDRQVRLVMTGKSHI